VVSSRHSASAEKAALKAVWVGNVSVCPDRRTETSARSGSTWGAYFPSQQRELCRPAYAPAPRPDGKPEVASASALCVRLRLGLG